MVFPGFRTSIDSIVVHTFTNANQMPMEHEMSKLICQSESLSRVWIKRICRDAKTRLRTFKHPRNPGWQECFLKFNAKMFRDF